MAKETEVSGLVAGDGRHVSTTLTLRRSLKVSLMFTVTHAAYVTHVKQAARATLSIVCAIEL